MPLIPVILSGGAGARLWPLSRELHPKPFMRLGGGESLLRRTYGRAAALDGVRAVLTVTNREHFFLSRDELEAVRRQQPGLEGRFLLEPFGRNTAPAIALAALSVAEEHGPAAVMLVLPADHLIENAPAFAAAAARAARAAEAGKVVVFGIPPTAPETGFGYIRTSGLGTEDWGLRVEQFVEKPDLARARAFLASGDYFWNSGMFCFTAETILAQLAQHAPTLLQQAQTCWAASKATRKEDTINLAPESFAALPDLSIDYAVMEHLSPESSVLIPVFDAGWSDVGSWDALCKLGEADASGNRVTGEAVLVDVADSLVSSDGRVVAAIGVRDLVIVDTPDALLVADRGHAQQVRQVVDELKRRQHESYRLHRTVSRPWGTYTVLEEGPRFKIKRIVVKPGASLSLQKHRHRSEHWVVVAGTAQVTNGEQERLVRVDESTYIPAGTPHRLSNPGDIDCVMIEVQSGDYVGEDDIERIEDSYGRTEG